MVSLSMHVQVRVSPTFLLLLLLLLLLWRGSGREWWEIEGEMDNGGRVVPTGVAHQVHTIISSVIHDVEIAHFVFRVSPAFNIKTNKQTKKDG